MFGANGRLLALNAQADERHATRSIRAYCLGQYGEGPEARARDSATTYITLIWRDTERVSRFPWAYACMPLAIAKTTRFAAAM